jgi:hypothetical protein
MRTARTFVALAAGLLACSTAASAAVVNGYNWDNVFTGDQIPLTTDSNWSVNTPSGSVSHVDPGTITLDSDVDGSVYIDSNIWAPANNATPTAEFKVKIERFNDGEESGTTLNVMDSTDGGMQLLLRSGRIAVLDNNGVTDNLYSVDTTQYHVYRVALNTTTATYSIYVDDMNTPVVVGQPLHTGLAYEVLRIGDPGSNTGGKATFEYVAFNNSTAPTPVPEPAIGLLVMAFAGAATLGRRRRAAKIA